MQVVKSVNIPLLKDYCSKNAVARRVFELYSDRHRTRGSSTVARIRRILHDDTGTPVSREEVLAMMRAWQQAGCGRLVTGTRDQDNRFLWSWDIPSLATQVVAVEAQDALPVAPVQPAPAFRAPPPPAVSGPAVMPGLRMRKPAPANAPLKVRFDGFEIDLPADMSKEEKEEAFAFIKNLRQVVSR